ncbi:cysteine hydrolase [Pendulispora rubella]|uniref:Cysteine hydrolase n=1 Tax=Pendulispora rubella TaxID=2741070 RepID=A0ABZ2LAB2_9BACT
MHEAFGLSIPHSLDDVCNPREMALLVYDMQVGIVRQVKNSKEILSGVGEVLEAARQVNMRIFYTRHLSLPRELMGSFQYRMAMRWQRVEKPELVKPWFLRDSPAFPIVPELEPRPSEAIFDKLAMSAFEGTPLTMALRDCGIRAVAIVGVALEVGIEPTVRHATDLGLIPVIVRDACGFGHEDAAQRTLASLAFGGDSIFTDITTFRQKLGLAH